LRVVGETREVDAVFLALEFFGVLALLAIVNLECLIILRYKAELSCVVEVDGRN